MEKQEVKIIELEKQLQGREMAEKELVKQKTVRESIFWVMFSIVIFRSTRCLYWS